MAMCAIMAHNFPVFRREGLQWTKLGISSRSQLYRVLLEGPAADAV
jgi:hypothetical protein